MRRRDYLLGLGVMATGVSSGCSLVENDRLTLANVESSQTSSGTIVLTVTVTNMADEPRRATLVGILEFDDGNTQRRQKPIGVPAGETRTFKIPVFPSYLALQRRARYAPGAELKNRGTLSKQATVNGMHQITDEAPVIEPPEPSHERRGPWPSYHYGNRNTGFNPTADGIATEPSVRWRLDSFDAVGNAAAPVVVDGTVYAGSTVTAFDSRTGERQWTVDAIERRSSLTMADGTLFFGTEAGEFVAVDSDSGEIQWRFSGASEDWVGGAAVASGGVYTTDARWDDDQHGGAVHAFDAETGTRQWTFETDGRFERGPAVLDGIVYAGRIGNVLHALDAETGEIAWEFATDAHITSSPAVAYETVYVGNDNAHLYAIDRESGAKRWVTVLGNYIGATPAVAHGLVFVSDTGDRMLHAVDAATGDVRWAFEADEDIFSSPSVAGRTVYIGSFDNHLYALDIETGDVRWQFDASESVTGSVAIGDGALYYHTSDSLYALEV